MSICHSVYVGFVAASACAPAQVLAPGPGAASPVASPGADDAVVLELGDVGGDEEEVDDPATPDRSRRHPFPIGDSPAMGPADAWVTIVEVVSFDCPACAGMQRTMAELVARYAGDVRVVFKHYSIELERRASPAALAAECARDQGRFWDMARVLFSHQDQLEDPGPTEYARDLGLDPRRWQECYESQKHVGRVEADTKRAIETHVFAIPAFFVNGRYVRGARPLANFSAIVDEELRAAKSCRVARPDFYRRVGLDR
jgi:protein-disulfide isomerase